MALGTITITGFNESRTGDKIFGPADINATGGAAAVTSVALALGNNSITVPSTSTAVIIRTPPDNTGSVITLKGVGADTGIRLANDGVSVIHFDVAAVPGTIVLNSSVAQTSNTEFLFI